MHKKPRNPRNYRPAVKASLIVGVLALLVAALFGSASATASTASTPPGAQLVAAFPTLSTPIGVQPDGRIAGCVRSTSGTAPAPLFVRRTTGTCGAGFKTVYWAQKGKTGPAGPAGARGPAGAPGAGAQALPFGVGTVSVKRGAGTASVWAKVSTPISSAEGGTVSSTFRMTCSTANAPCTISAQARATVAGGTVHPRLLINRSSIDTGAPLGMCEYADGTTNDGGTQALTTTSAGLPLGIGGSLDCGAGQVRPSSGVVDSIDVPAGYYDVAATFDFGG